MDNGIRESSTLEILLSKLPSDKGNPGISADMQNSQYGSSSSLISGFRSRDYSGQSNQVSMLLIILL